MTMRGFLCDEQAQVAERPCRCGRGPQRPGQRTCLQCHAEDMQERRAEEGEEIERLKREIERLSAENHRLDALVNSPEIHDFAKAVVLEAAHQLERWDPNHDASKTGADWFWLIGYLAGKALHTPIGKDFASTGLSSEEIRQRKLHRIITIAAAAANWHAHVLAGEDG